ncbi:hypothetical protein FOA52_007333 [Chlamydomonas sp. UWO 241]|nr:hypothetical protein FOA52_007333 [Chlamydomonas sp. UWO 241]
MAGDAYMPISKLVSAEKDGKEEDVLAKRTTAKGIWLSFSEGWRSTLSWAGFVLVAYSVVQSVLPKIMRRDPDAVAHLLTHVPMRGYQYSEAAFFTAAVLNFLSVFYEETQEKRQLAMLSMLIKALSWHCDMLIVTGRAVVVYDAYGALLMPSRYVQWACTTPTMLFTISKITDFSPRRVAYAMGCDWLMIATGFIAAVMPPGFISAIFFNASCVFFYVTLRELYYMIQSALSEANSPHAKTSLNITLWSSLAIWHLFPLGWTLARMGPSFDWLAEPCMLAANFGAKVVFSSCILYNNYVTLQQRRVAAQLVQEHADRIRMVADLKESLQHKDEFISVIGHELRTPLNAVIKLSTAIAGNFGVPEYLPRHRVWMETITRSARHLLGIINDIITMKAARSGIHLKQELVYVDRVVDHVMRTLTPMAQRDVVVEKIVAKLLPPIVADERRVIQVLSNILGNALKFTEKGKVCVRVRMDKPGHNIVIKITDTGCGIPKEELGSLLQPFKQVDMTNRRKYGGTGLGLSIAHQLVQAHSGRMELDSQPGKGTTAVVTFPVLQPETVDMLEAPFRKAYGQAGYSFDDLMSPQAAAAENRRLVSFVAVDVVHNPPGSYASRRGSIGSIGNSSSQQTFSTPPASLQVSQSPGRARPPTGNRQSIGSRASAAGSSNRSSFEAGSVASADVEHFRGVQNVGGGGGGDGCGYEYGYDNNDDDEDAGESAAGGGGGGPPPMAVALISSLYERTVPGVPPSAPSSGAAARAVSKSSVSKHGVASQLHLCQGCGLPPASANPGCLVHAGHVDGSGLPHLPEMVEEGDDDFKPVWNEYQGSWHKPAKFNDGKDAEKSYYSYENRISYEYRESLDNGHAAAAWWKSTQRQPTTGSLDEGSAERPKGIIRRSVDVVRKSLSIEPSSASGRRASGLGTPTSTSNVNDEMSGSAVTAPGANRASGGSGGSDQTPATPPVADIRQTAGTGDGGTAGGASIGSSGAASHARKAPAAGGGVGAARNAELAAKFRLAAKGGGAAGAGGLRGAPVTAQ